MGIFDRFIKHPQIKSAEAYKDTMRSAERLTTASLTLFASKTSEEQKEIMADVMTLSEKLHEAIDHETPLIISMTLLTALQAMDLEMQRLVDAGF